MVRIHKCVSFMITNLDLRPGLFPDLPDLAPSLPDDLPHFGPPYADLLFWKRAPGLFPSSGPVLREEILSDGPKNIGPVPKIEEIRYVPMS